MTSPDNPEGHHRRQEIRYWELIFKLMGTVKAATDGRTRAAIQEEFPKSCCQSHAPFNRRLSAHGHRFVLLASIDAKIDQRETDRIQNQLRRMDLGLDESISMTKAGIHE
jgi:hypothetical protein